MELIHRLRKAADDPLCNTCMVPPLLLHQAADALHTGALINQMERQRCADDIAFELGMTGTPTFDDVLGHLRLLYKRLAQQLQDDVSRPRAS